MNDRPLASAYASLLSDLGALLVRDFVWPSPEAGFAMFVFHRAREDGPLPQPANLTWPPNDRLVHAPSLAAAGYWVGCGQGAALLPSWLDGLDRLRGRDPFPTDRQSFTHRPVELLGIAVGITACAKDQPGLVGWLNGVIDQIRSEPAPDLWASYLRLAAEHMITPQSVPVTHQAGEGTLVEAALARWVTSCLRGLTASADADSTLLRGAMLKPVVALDLARAAVLFHSLRSVVADVIESETERHWQVGRKQRDAEALVATLCRRFHLFAQQLLVRRDGRGTITIADEYDVQYLMRALLMFHFDDVRAEEVTPSVGGKSGRMDFLLKRERLVIETKMTRKNLRQKEVGDELIIDMKRYHSHPDYRTLVCLVYDPGGFCHAHAALENDLSGLDAAGFRTHVIVCPKGM